MHNPEFVVENEAYKLLKDFVIQTDHLFSARQPGLVITNKQKRKFAELWTLLSTE